MAASALTTRIEAVEEAIKDQSKFINGNGTPGAKVRLAALEANDKMICDKIDEIKKSTDRLTTAIISFILAIFGVSFSIGIWFFTNFVPTVMAAINK